MKAMYINTILLTTVIAVNACSDKDSPVLTHRDLDGTTEYFASEDEMMFTTLYKPAVGYVADPMPFYDPVAKDYKVMYLQDYRPNQVATYHPIWAVSTDDAASYVSMGELVPCGGASEQDAAIGTGSVIYNPKDELYYVFYTGNKHQATASDFPQAVMYATSKDFREWTKCRTFLLTGPENGYSRNDFRDPHVLADEEGLYHMVISTSKEGKGVLAEYVSADMVSWEHKGVFMTMMWDRFYECPDIFRMGNWWYLVYSEIHSAVRKVQYFKGRTLDELKACTAGDAGIWPDSKEGFLDSRGFYAGKTASDGIDRYIWGWCADRQGSDNLNLYDWGGCLVAHKLKQNDDGTLVCVPVPAVKAKFDGCEVEEADSFELKPGEHRLLKRLGVHNYLSLKVNATGRFGLSFVRGSDSEKYYSLVFNPEDGGIRRKINFEQEGNEAVGFLEGSDSYIFEAPDDNMYNIVISTDNSVLTMYVNDVLAYTCRIYGLAKNPWSVNCYDGTLSVTDLSFAKYN